MARPRKLSEIRLLYCGWAGFGQIFRSFSFNSQHYLPQMMEEFDSNLHNFVTITNLGQPPRNIVECGPSIGWWSLKTMLLID